MASLTLCEVCKNLLFKSNGHSFRGRIPHRFCQILSKNRPLSNNVITNEIVESHRNSKLSASPEEDDEETPTTTTTVHFREKYPDFLPNPNWQWRDRIAEKLEREDMYKRRSCLHIPEFYVGSILAVTVADQHAPGKQNRFLGIVISRGGHGLKSMFTLRNVIDSEGIEIMYEMYSPVIQRIELIKLEKRLDSELYYLRDAPQEFSTFPFNMTAVTLPKGSHIPVNNLKVTLNPRPWHERWERKNLQGINDLNLRPVFYERAKALEKPWEKYDMMKEYRLMINDEDAGKIEAEMNRQTSKMKLNSELNDNKPIKHT